jgi:3-methyl-2-oxobutanoate hydroxymethyltransferase
VLEKIPASLAKKVSSSIKIPTIGIGGGVDCDGQVLVTYDMLGLTEEFHPRFVRKYLNLASELKDAFGKYIKDIKEKKFPSKTESY